MFVGTGSTVDVGAESVVGGDVVVTASQLRGNWITVDLVVGDTGDFVSVITNGASALVVVLESRTVGNVTG